MPATPPLTPKPPAPPKPPKPPKGPSTHERIVTGARHAKALHEQTATSSKPSVRRGMVGGAAAGAATGASLGSVVPGVGTGVGATVGAGIGGIAGGKRAHRDKVAARRAALGPGRQLLVAEFLVCMVILALSPLTDRHKTEGPQAFLKRGAATCALFFILGTVSSAGRGPTKVAAYGGALVTLALLVSSRDVFAVIASKISGGDTSVQAGADGAAVGQALQQVAADNSDDGQDDQDDQGDDGSDDVGGGAAAGPLGNGIR